MIAKVIRNGQHSGGDKFVEVQETPSSPPYAVPVSQDIAPGSEVEIVVTLKSVPKEPESVVEERVVSPATAEAFAVETSPIAPIDTTVAPTASDESAVEEEEPVVKQGKLPEDFPGHAALAEAGINTFNQLRKAGDVTEIPGIGPATAEKIQAALEEE